MDEYAFNGTGADLDGAVETVAARMAGDPQPGARARARVKASIARAQDAVAEAADKVADKVVEASAKANVMADTLGERATDAYGKAVLTARQLDATIEPFVQERPYAALGIAAGLGIVAGLLLAGRGPKVIYVRPRA